MVLYRMSLSLACSLAAEFKYHVQLQFQSMLRFQLPFPSQYNHPFRWSSRLRLQLRFTILLQIHPGMFTPRNPLNRKSIEIHKWQRTPSPAPTVWLQLAWPAHCVRSCFSKVCTLRSRFEVCVTLVSTFGFWGTWSGNAS